MTLRLSIAAGAAVALALVLGGCRHHHGPHHGMDRMQQHMDRMLERMDADGDGRIGLAEWDRAHRERFAAMDANHDGVLTRDELEAGHREMRERHRGR